MDSSDTDLHQSHLQPDGTTFPPVTPDPPAPPGYVDPLATWEVALDADEAGEHALVDSGEPGAEQS